MDPPTALAHLPRASEQSSGALPLAVAAVALGLDQLVHHAAHRTIQARHATARDGVRGGKRDHIGGRVPERLDSPALPFRERDAPIRERDVGRASAIEAVNAAETARKAAQEMQPLAGGGGDGGAGGGAADSAAGAGGGGPEPTAYEKAERWAGENGGR